MLRLWHHIWYAFQLPRGWPRYCKGALSRLRQRLRGQHQLLVRRQELHSARLPKTRWPGLQRSERVSRCQRRRQRVFQEVQSAQLVGSHAHPWHRLQRNEIADARLHLCPILPNDGCRSGDRWLRVLGAQGFQRKIRALYVIYRLSQDGLQLERYLQLVSGLFKRLVRYVWRHSRNADRWIRFNDSCEGFHTNHLTPANLLLDWRKYMLMPQWDTNCRGKHHQNRAYSRGRKFPWPSVQRGQIGLIRDFFDLRRFGNSFLRYHCLRALQTLEKLGP